MTDILKTIEPKSDQQNFDDYLGGPKTVTIAEVKVLNGGEQPVEVHLIEFPGRPFKPGKSMRRVLIAAWGKQSVEWTGRRMTLYGDPTVKFGGQAVGGIRISHLSDITGPLEVHLTVTRGKRAPFIVQPLDGRDWLGELELAGDDLDAITALGKSAGDAHAPADVIEALRAKFRSLTKETPAGKTPGEREPGSADGPTASGTSSLPAELDPASPDYIAPEEQR